MYNFARLKQLKPRQFLAKIEQLLPRYYMVIDQFMKQDPSRGLHGSMHVPTKTSLCSGRGSHKLHTYLLVLLWNEPPPSQHPNSGIISLTTSRLTVVTRYDVCMGIWGHGCMYIYVHVIPTV